MSQENQLPVSIRNIRARLRPLQRPIVWGTLVFLSVFTLFSWELSSNPEQFSTPESTSDTSDTSEFSDSLEGEDEEAEAIAADIDSSSVLEEDMKRMEKPAPVLPMTGFKPPEPKKTETPELSTLTTPPAILPNPSPPGLGNIFLSGNGAQVQTEGVFSPNLSGNQVNNISSGNEIDLSRGNGGMNSSSIAVNNNNVPNGNNSGASISPLQEAIMRRTAVTNTPNPEGVATSQTVTTPESTGNRPQGSSPTSAASQVNSAIGGNQLPTASTGVNNLLLDAQTNQLNSPGTTDQTANTPQTDASPGFTEQLTPNTESFIPLAPTSSRGTNASERGYNPYNQSAPNNSTNQNNSYQYLLQSSGSNSSAGATNPQQLNNPRSLPALTNPTAPRTSSQPSMPFTDTSDLETTYPQNLDAIAQPSAPTNTQPSVQNTPSLRSVEIPQGVQTSVPNANGLTGQGVNSNLSNSQGQTLQPAPTFTVPRPIPGRYIGGGQINTFSNP